MNHQLSLQPLARTTDPPASHVNGNRARRKRTDVVAAIRNVVRLSDKPLTQFEIADKVRELHPEKGWTEQTVRSACCDAGLYLIKGATGTSPSGATCGFYALAIETVVEVQDGRL